jgi:hypothetical protein
MSSLTATITLFGPGSEWLWAMCQAIAVPVTLALILRQIKLQNDSHLVNSFAIFGTRWNSEMMLKARQEVCSRYQPNNDYVDATLTHVCLFYEELGIFCAKNILNSDVVWELFSFDIEHYWIMSRSAIATFRRNQNDQTFYSHFEDLHKRMKRHSDRNGAPTHERTPEDVAKYIHFELEKVKYFSTEPIPPLPSRRQPQPHLPPAGKGPQAR